MFATHRHSQKIDLAELTGFLTALGYEVISLRQPWRHVVGIIRQASTKLFFKMGSTSVVSIRTRNEYAWNAVFDHNMGLLPTGLRIPRNYDHGLYNNELFWLVCEYFEGPVLAERMSASVDTLYSWLELVASTLAQFSARSPGTWTLADRERMRQIGENADIHQWVSQSASFYLSQTKQSSISPNILQWLLSIIEDGPVFPASHLQHGDCTPWHMLALASDTVGLVDAEHAGMFLPEYYDAAYYYQRIYAVLRQPQLAKIFLRKFRESLPNLPAQSIFLDQIKPVMAQRIIGGLWDAVNNGEQDLHCHQRLINDLMNEELL